MCGSCLSVRDCLGMFWVARRSITIRGVDCNYATMGDKDGVLMALVLGKHALVICTTHNW